MGPARRRFHGVPRCSRGPRGSSTRCKPLEPLDREDFLGEFFFHSLSRSLRQFRILLPPSEFSGERIISQRWLNCIRGRETSVVTSFFFFLVTIRAYYIDITLYISSILRELSPKEQYIINGDRASWRKLTRNGDCYGRLRETFDRRID